MKLENFANPIEEEKEFDPYLEQLWSEYDWIGDPPKNGSKAEERLRKSCEEYSHYLDAQNYQGKSIDLLKSSDARRRQLHNEIALMVLSKQRSGMPPSLAQKITDFAYEYIKGYKPKDAHKYENPGA